MRRLGTRSIILTCFLAAATSQPCAQTAPAKDLWTSLEFLAGTWVGEGSGDPGPSGTGGSTFTFELDKQIMVRKNWAKYAPKPGEKTGISHEDLMIIYPDPAHAAFRAIYFDNEGHLINYVASFPKQKAVTFESEASQPGPRYRLTYDLGSDGRLVIVFSIAVPGQPFKEYTRGFAHREK